MLLNKQIKITVFQVTNDIFEQIGEIGQYTSLIWPDAYNGFAQFELWAPITADNSEMIKKGNVIWCDGENAAVIEIVKSTIDDDGVKTFNVKGRTLEKFLTDRIIWGGYTNSGKTSTIMYDIVDKCCVNPINPARKIPWLICSQDTQIGLQISQYQKTGGEVYDAVYNLASDADIGFSVIFDPRNKRLIFEVRQGVDRTVNQSQYDPVEFSTDLEDLLSSSYYSNDQDKKTVAFVQGEDSGANRKSVVAGDNYGEGFERRELYVDARDLQSEVYNEDGSSTSLTPSQYQSTLVERGKEKLSECQSVETFEAQIRVFGDVQYEYGVDYMKGDKVTVTDKQLGISVSARVTNVEEDFNDEYALILTFGYAYPTIIQKMRQAAN